MTPINWLTILHYRRRWSHAPPLRHLVFPLQNPGIKEKGKTSRAVNRRFPRNEKISIKKKKGKKLKNFLLLSFFFRFPNDSFNFNSRVEFYGERKWFKHDTFLSMERGGVLQERICLIILSSYSCNNFFFNLICREYEGRIVTCAYGEMHTP